MKRFEYNNYGVCMNPEIIGGQGEHNENCIMVAKSEVSGWLVGYRYHIANGGGCYPVSIQDANRFATRRDAVLYAVKRLRSVVEANKNIDCSAVTMCIEQAYNEVTQTTLEF